MTRALYRPSQLPILSKGEGLPRGAKPEAAEARQQLADLLCDDESPVRVYRPMHATDYEYTALLDERMRTMSMAERIDMEIELTQRFLRSHTSDYDPLKY